MPDKRNTGMTPQDSRHLLHPLYNGNFLTPHASIPRPGIYCICLSRSMHNAVFIVFVGPFADVLPEKMLAKDALAWVNSNKPD